MKKYVLLMLVLLTSGCFEPGYPRVSPAPTPPATEIIPTQPPAETQIPEVEHEQPATTPETTPEPAPLTPQTPAATEAPELTPPPEPVQQPFTLLWEYNTVFDVNGIDITDDGELIVAGSFDLYAFNRTGDLLWQNKLLGSASDVSLTPDGERIVVSSYISPNGTVYLFDSQGGLLWKKTLEDGAWGVDISSDGKTIALAMDGDKIRILDEIGNTRWEYDTRYSAWGVWAVSIKPDGSVVGGSDDTYFYVLSPDGQLIFEESQGPAGHTTGVAVSRVGDYLGVVTSRSRSVYFYRGTDLLWERQTGFNNVDIDLTPNGELVAVASYDKNVYLFNRKGELIVKIPLAERVQSVALSSDGGYLAIGTWNGGIYLFEVKP
jgi:WD40 repeat protein